MIPVTPSGKEDNSADSSVSVEDGPTEVATLGTDPVACTPGIPEVTAVSMRGVFVLILFSAASTAAIADARNSKDSASPDSATDELWENDFDS